MPYGTIKVDNVTFTNAGVDQNVTVSGLYASTTSNLSVTGTVSGSVLIGSTTVSGATVSGQNASFVSGVFTTGLFSGRVGIGTVTPGYRLTVVNSTGAFDTNLFLTETADPTSKRTALSFNNAWLLNSDTNGVGVEDFGIYSVANNRTLLNFTSGGGTLIDTASGQVPLILYSVGSEIARFTASSRLGLGTATPNGLLHLQGNSIAESWYTATGASGGSWRVGVGDSLAGLNGGYRIYDATNSATRFFITSGGFVGVKTATPNASFHANHTTLVEPSLIYNSTAGQVFQNELNELAFGVATGVPYATWMQTRSAFSAATPLAINPSGGFIGIGTKSPGSILHCNIATATDTYVRTTNSTGTAGFDFGISSGAEAYLFNRNNTNLYFGTNSLVRATITSGGLVGINTTSPTSLLDVRGYSKFGAYSGVYQGISIVNNDNSALSETVSFVDAINDLGTIDSHIFFTHQTTGASSIAIATTATGSRSSDRRAERVRIDGLGRVGIGTATPQSPVDLTSGIAGELTIFINNTNVSGYSALRFGNSDRGTNGDHLLYGGDRLGIRSKAGTNIVLEPTGTERARLDTAGRLLIGTDATRSVGDNFGGTTTQVLFETVDIAAFTAVGNKADASGPMVVLGKSRAGAVKGVTAVQSGDTLGILRFAGANGTDLQSMAGQVYCQVDGTVSSGSMPGRLVFGTTVSGSVSPVERMRISSSGFTSINTTVNNGYFLSVSGVNAGQFGDAQDVGYGTLQVTRPADQPDNKFHLAFVRLGNKIAGMGFLDNSNTFAIQNENNNAGAGVTLTTAATSWGTTSDERKKQIKSNIENGFEKLKDWRCVYFSYLGEPETVRRIGLIAQDVQQTVPEAISTEEDEIGTLQLRYTELIPVLVKALQESKERIETLEAKVQAIEAT